MTNPDEEINEVQIDIEVVVFSLFQAYPNVNYIALNTGLTSLNQDEWTDHWYFIGFDEPPVYKLLDGYPAWVANEDIETGEDEWGLFFLHISSKSHYFNDAPIQTDPYEYVSPRFLCWRREAEDGITQLYTDEIEIEDNSSEVQANINELAQSVYLNTATSLLEGKVSNSKFSKPR